MNFLFIAAVLFFVLSKNKQSDLNELLQGVNVEDVIGLLKNFGLSDKLSGSLLELIPSIMSGNADFYGILKSALPLIMSLTNKGGLSQTDTPTQKDEQDSFYQGITPIKEFAPPAVTQGLQNYFE